MASLLASLPNRALAPLLVLLLVGAACGGDDDDDSPGDADDDGGPDAAAEGITIPDLDGPVTVFFDEQGILHASCQSDADCFAVEGYFHAAHRFGQMDIRRRFGRGRIAALAGSLALATDRDQRQMMTARDGTPLEERLLEGADAATIAALEAYSRGVNAWLQDLADERNGAVLPDEYSSSLISPAALEAAKQDDWEPLDSVACILPLVDQLTNDAGTDTQAGQIYGVLPALLAEDLFGLRPPSTSSVLPPVITGKRRASRAGRALHARLARSRDLLTRALRRMPGASLDRSSRGSNNWIVGPSKTKSGGALLANDPHLSLSHPAIWYLVNLDAKSGGGDMHVAGASFAGLPGVLLGHNEDIAWGATTTYFDATDVYVETLNKDGTAVLFNGEEVPIEQKEYTFEVAGQEPETVSFPFVPHHGPIIETDAKAGTALSVRWIGHDADTDINFFLALSRSKSVEEAREALKSVTTAGQNFIVADRDGNIGWFPYNRLPTRPWVSAETPSWLPVPGTGEFEWGEPIPYEALPQSFNPATGFLATANNDMTGALQDGDPTNDGFPWVQGYVDEGYRHQRIVERLVERDDHDLASMESIQADVFSLLGELLTPAILADVDGVELDADAQAVVDALAAWDFQCASGLAGIEPDAPADPATAASARGCAAFHTTWARLRKVFDDELRAAVGDRDLTLHAQPAALIFAMTQPGTLSRSYWNDVETAAPETEADMVAAALSSAGAFLRKELGEDPAAWLWGRIHTVSLRADLFNLLTPDYNSAPFSNDGGLFTVDVANPGGELSDSYVQPNGPSMRLACETGEPDGVNCTIELPGGQRHDRGSAFYNSMLDEWLTNQPAPFVFAVEDLAAMTVETVRVEPR